MQHLSSRTTKKVVLTHPATPVCQIHTVGIVDHTMIQKALVYLETTTIALITIQTIVSVISGSMTSVLLTFIPLTPIWLLCSPFSPFSASVLV